MTLDSAEMTDESTGDGSEPGPGAGLLPMGVDHRTTVRALWVLMLVLLVLTIEGVARTQLLPTTQIVSTTAMLRALADLVISGDTALRVGIAFVAAAATGISVGWLLWYNGTLFQILNPYLIVLYAMPIFVFYPMLIILFGLGSLPIILISYVMSVTVVVISTAEGLNKIPEIFFDASRSLNLTSYQSITRVQLPAAVPYIFTGLKLGFIYAFIGVIASEFILANAGLGYFVSLQYERFETAEMYASIAVIVVFAATINSVLVRVEDRLYKRGAR